jgi:hypothetical protein
MTDMKTIVVIHNTNKTKLALVLLNTGVPKVWLKMTCQCR